MIVFPAVDLRGGRVVRLRQGRADAETVYGDNPAQVAERWQTQGAEWLHIVNLDGAFGENAAANLDALAAILRRVHIPVQFGGGLRDLASIRSAFDRGVARVVVGTGAIQNPALVTEAISEFGAEGVAVGIDARDGIVATHGWKALAGISAFDLANQMAERGITRIVYTDITRDGMLDGIDANAMAAMAEATGMRVIASGGVASLEDIKALAAHETAGVEGVIVGQALYAGAVDLGAAIAAGKGEAC